MRSRPLALGGLLAGGLLGVVASARPWWRATGDGVAVTFSGSEATAGLSQALAIVVLAGWVLILVLRATAVGSSAAGSESATMPPPAWT